MLSQIVLLTTLSSSLTPCYVAICTSGAIVDMQIVDGARYPDHFFTRSADPNRYIPIILGWSHLIWDHMFVFIIKLSWKSLIAMFHDNLISLMSFHFVQTYCLAWVKAVTCYPLLLLKHPDFFAHHVSFPLWTHFGEYFVARATQPSSIGLSDAYDVFDSLASFRPRAALTADHFLPNFISWYAFRMTSSAECFIIWRRTFPILNSSTSEDIGSYRFPELVYKPTFEKQGVTPCYWRRYLLLYFWIHTAPYSAISYIYKAHKRRGQQTTLVTPSLHLSG